MLAMSSIDSTESFDVVVQGQVGQNHICIDLECDHVPLGLSDINVSVDIDSLIWVSSHLHFCKAMSIFLGPVLDKEASIQKYNHVYVEVLVSHSEEDANALDGHIE